MVDSPINSAVFANIKDMLMQQFNKTNVEADCMVNDIVEKKIVERFNAANLTSDRNFLRKSLEPFLPTAEKICQFHELTKDNSFGAGWIAVVIAGIVIIAVVVGLIIRARKNSRWSCWLALPLCPNEVSTIKTLSAWNTDKRLFWFRWLKF